MIERCLMCHTTFQKNMNRDAGFIPDVCSSKCFKEFILSYKDEELLMDNSIQINSPSLMRSSYEDMFANWLEINGIEYEYEPILYVTPKILYIPDFKIKNKNLFFEVKGRWYDNARTKFRAFRNETKADIYLINMQVLKRIYIYP